MQYGTYTLALRYIENYPAKHRENSSSTIKPRRCRLLAGGGIRYRPVWRGARVDEWGEGTNGPGAVTVLLCEHWCSYCTTAWALVMWFDYRREATGSFYCSLKWTVTETCRSVCGKCCSEDYEGEKNCSQII